MKITCANASTILCALVGYGLLSTPAFADESMAELAKQTQNPVANLISLPMQLNYDHDIGPKQDGDTWYLKVEPVIPFSLNEDWLVVSRTIALLETQRDFAPNLGSTSGFGDTTQTFFFSPKQATASGWIWGLGPALLLPTGGNSQLSAEKWGAGPSGVLLKQENGWTVGILATQTWSFAGDSKREDVNSTYLQPFLSYTNSHYTSFGVDTESTYNRKAKGHGNAWSVPLNFYVTQLLKVDEQLISLQAGVRYWADTPNNVGPENWGLRFTATFLFPEK